MKPRYRWDWDCSWWYQHDDGWFRVWMAPHWTICTKVAHESN